MDKQQKNNIPVKDWINQYKEQFERYNSYCDTNNWIYAEDVEEEYGVQKDISLIVLDRLKYFVKKFEPYLEFKYVKNFIDLMQIPVSLFLDRCNFYFENNDWLKETDKQKQIEEMKFQSDMMSDFNKLKDKLQEINLDEEFISLALPIFGDKNIPFLMQDMMESRYPEIQKFREVYANNGLVDESGIPSLTPYDVLNSTEMFLNIKNPPIYDSSKHYFEQSQEVLDFYTEEYKKITQGVTIAGVFIHPLLYWYLNFFKTDIPMSQFKNTPLYNPSKKRLITNPFLRDNELFYVESYAEADEKNVGLFAFGTRRWGKELADYEPIITPNGEVPIGSIKEGDIVYGRDGKKTSVIGVFPQGVKPIYRMYLKDGRTIDSGLEHQWVVKTNGKEKILTTKELLNNKLKYEHSKSGFTYRYYIPINSEVEFNEKELPINPYLMGIFLGDGSISNGLPKFSSIDQEVVNKIQEILGKDYTITNDENDLKTKGYYCKRYIKYIGKDKYVIDKKGHNPLSRIIVENNYDKDFSEKYIPHIYKFSSIEQRYELLKGLMDSDGSINKDGCIEFTVNNEILVNDVAWLCRSLGIRCEITFTDNGIVEKKIGDNKPIIVHDKKWRLHIRTDKSIFSLKRKIDRIKVRKNTSDVAIDRIEYIGDYSATCISVDNDDHLFLTKDFIVTHNTVMESAILSWSCTTVENSEALVIGGDEGDLQKLSKTLEIAFTNVHSAFYLPKNNNDWSKLIQFGLKNKAGERIPYGDIFIRNVNKGQEGSSEKTAGATPTAWIVDEAGKFNCKSMFQAAIPSFQTPDGWSLVPILSGCLTAGNKVFTKDGNLVNIEDLKYENGIVGFNNETQEVSFEDITNINPPQFKDCYKIITNKGTEIECSFDHPFLIKNRDKLETYINKEGIKNRRRKLDFIEAKELAVGTQLCLPDIIPLKGTKKMIEPYFIGAIIGDGNYSSDRGIRFSNEDKEIWDYFDSIGKDYRIDKEYVTEKGRIYKEVGFRGGMKYIKELGIYGQKGSSKDLPINIHLYQQNDVCELLAGLYDTDGSIIKNNANDKNFTIQLTSSSELLINSVKLLLIRLGIHSNKSFVKPDNRDRHIKSKNGYFNLLISDRKSILNFYDLIPIKINRKKEKLSEIIDILKNRVNKLDKHYPNLRFEKIISIEYVGSKPVYNLTTSTTHTYLANGVITHNTGGNVDLSIDAQNMLMNPEENSILPMNWDRLDNMVQDKDLITWKRKNFGLFLPSQMSFKDGLRKVDKSLSEYFNIDDERLQRINIKVTDWVNSNKVIKEDREKKKKDKTGLNKEKMYYPIDPNDCFLNKIENPFPSLEAQLHKEYLIENGLTGRNVDIYRKQGTKLGWEFSDKDLPSFPFEGGNIDSPVILFEDPPEDNDIDGTYVSGLDHYKHNKASTNSLGANYIFKRNVNLDEWSDRVVACYYARPETIEKFNNINEMLIEGYGAECLQENADISFEQHLKAKHKLNLLANGEELAKRLINPRASQNNKYGLNPNEKNQQYILNLVIDYCQEDIEIGEDEHGDKIIVKGVTKIPDIGLLDEIINFHYGGNFDKLIAFGHALAWARYLDSLNIMPKVKKKYTNDSTYKKQMRQDKLRAKSPYSYGNYKLYKT